VISNWSDSIGKSAAEPFVGPAVRLSPSGEKWADGDVLSLRRAAAY